MAAAPEVNTAVPGDSNTHTLPVEAMLRAGTIKADADDVDQGAPQPARTHQNVRYMMERAYEGPTTAASVGNGMPQSDRSIRFERYPGVEAHDDVHAPQRRPPSVVVYSPACVLVLPSLRIAHEYTSAKVSDGYISSLFACSLPAACMCHQMQDQEAAGQDDDQVPPGFDIIHVDNAEVHPSYVVGDFDPAVFKFNPIKCNGGKFSNPHYQLGRILEAHPQTLTYTRVHGWMARGSDLGDTDYGDMCYHDSVEPFEWVGYHCDEDAEALAAPYLKDQGAYLPCYLTCFQKRDERGGDHWYHMEGCQHGTAGPVLYSFRTRVREGLLLTPAGVRVSALGSQYDSDFYPITTPSGYMITTRPLPLRGGGRNRWGPEMGPQGGNYQSYHGGTNSYFGGTNYDVQVRDNYTDGESLDLQPRPQGSTTRALPVPPSYTTVSRPPNGEPITHHLPLVPSCGDMPTLDRLTAQQVTFLATDRPTR